MYDAVKLGLHTELYSKGCTIKRIHSLKYSLQVGTNTPEMFCKRNTRFQKSTLLQDFDMRKKIFVVTDAHITSLRAILAQGDDLESARPVVIVNNVESRK